MKRRVKCGIKSVITIAIIGIALCVRMKSSKSNEEISIIGQVYSNEKQYNEILINYPQLQGLDDSVKEKKINDLIKKDVLGILEKETLFKENNLAMHLDYEIKFLNENIISIFYEGWSGAVHNGNTLPPFCVATTIDMQQERIVALKEIIIDFDALGRLLLADKFENISTWEGGKSFQKMSNSGVGSDELIELLMKEDYEVADDYIQWYTDGNNLVVVYCKRYYEEYSTDVAVVEYIMYDNFVNSIAGENQIEYKAEVIDEKTMTEEIDLIEDIEKKYNILEYDICGTKRVDYENTILKEYVKKDIEDAMRVSSKFSIDYHLFDFNDDGMEDYLVCFDGIVWSEEAGDLVRIYIQEENGNLRRVFNRNLHIHENEIDGHASLVILEQKTNGYYDIVVPNSTQIMRYNRKKGEYVF